MKGIKKMKTLKVMSIISLVISALTAIAFFSSEEFITADEAFGWAVILLIWSIAFAVVVLVQAIKKNKE